MTFSLIRSEDLPTLSLTLETYRHDQTGAMHYHFAADRAENVFMVALRTMPENSTGVAHILEHTALCGSERFPVRDPFFSMLKRSLQTFMNAFTSSDWTAYPFATENREDFDNLLQIYLDAVFFPRLDRYDFLQEGHRLEFEGDELVTKGVVYNEMKGVYSNGEERIYELLKSYLQPSTTYHYDSGGIPSHILDLDYEDFLAFHAKHYHPTNATFFTFGDISASEHHARFEELALRRFENMGEKILSTDEKRFISPISITTGYPQSSNTEANTHILVSWLLGDAYDALEYYESELISRYLLDNSASPLRRALEEASWSESPSPLSMLDNSARELRFSAGIVTHESDKTAATEALILDTLTRVVEDGIDPNTLLGLLDRIELGIREESSSYPYGLSLFLNCIGATIHGGNVAKLLDPTEALLTIRERLSDTTYATNLIKKFFLENPHRLTLTVVPDENAGKREESLEKSYHKKLLTSLTDDAKSEIREDMQILAERQSHEEKNLDLLPKLEITDIPKVVRPLRIEKTLDRNFTRYTTATNHICYRNILFPLTDLSYQDVIDINLWSSLIAEVGTTHENYLEIQKKISAYTGGISARSIIDTEYGTHHLRAFFMISTRYLDRKQASADELIRDIAFSSVTHECDHIRDIFREERLESRSSMIQNGHTIARMRASSPFTMKARLLETTHGIASLHHLQNIIKKDNSEIEAIFAKISGKIQQNPAYEYFIGDASVDAKPLGGFFDSKKNTLEIEHDRGHIDEAWIADISVNYIALAFETVPEYHRDAPALQILAQYLRDNYLHNAIREKGGAYGGGASYNTTANAFEFFSYRDPRISGTFEDFERSIDWLLSHDHDEAKLDEAKLGVFSKMDPPLSRAEEATTEYIRGLFGVTTEIRNARRNALLAVRIEDLVRVARTYLTDKKGANRVIITGKQHTNEAESLGLTIRELE